MREIGDRGLLSCPSQPEEAVPPAPVHVAGAMPAATAVATTPRPSISSPSANQGFTPSLRASPASSSGVLTTTQTGAQETAGVVGFAQLAEFFGAERQREDSLREELETKLERLRGELAPASPLELVSAEDLTALQERFERLHGSKLLSDAQYFTLEDLISDGAELRQSLLPHLITSEQANATPAQRATFGVALKLSKVVGCSATFGSDTAFARQLRRKYL